MSKNFYISDLHFFHKNIIKLCNRPWMTVESMNSGLIRLWNQVVSEEDNVYILGDFAFKFECALEVKEILQQLKGHKHLIIGNHEAILSYPQILQEFDSIDQYLEIEDEGRKVVLFHYPMEDWNGRFKGSIHLFGHIHNNWSAIRGAINNRYNVSCEVLNFQPQTLNQIMKIKQF